MNVAALRQPIGALGSNAEMRMPLTRQRLNSLLSMRMPNQAEVEKSRACVEVIYGTPQAGDDMTRTSTKVENDIKYRHNDRHQPIVGSTVLPRSNSRVIMLANSGNPTPLRQGHGNPELGEES